MANPFLGALTPARTSTALPASSGTPGQITASTVPGYARMAFLPRVFGPRHVIVGESAVFNWMKSLCPAYSGGFWDFVDLSNGGFYLRLQTDTPTFLVRVDGNGFEGELTPDAASIVATLFAINQLLFTGAEHLDDAFYKLRDYALQQPEARHIVSAID
jgi:Antirestriction protein